MTEVVDIFSEWSGDEEMLDENGEVVEFDDLLEDRVDIYNSNMVEMGDDYVSVGIVEITE